MSILRTFVCQVCRSGTVCTASCSVCPIKGYSWSTLLVGDPPLGLIPLTFPSVTSLSTVPVLLDIWPNYRRYAWLMRFRNSDMMSSSFTMEMFVRCSIQDILRIRRNTQSFLFSSCMLSSWPTSSSISNIVHIFQVKYGKFIKTGCILNYNSIKIYY